MSVRHLDATCFTPASGWPTAGSPPVAVCGATGAPLAVTFTLEGTTCPACLVRYDEASTAGVVRLEPWGEEHEVITTTASAGELVRHLDAACLVATAVHFMPACGAPSRARPVITLEGVTCPECRARYEAAAAAGLVYLEPWGSEHRVEPFDLGNP